MPTDTTGKHDSRTDPLRAELEGIGRAWRRTMPREDCFGLKETDGLFVVQPEEIGSFLLPLPVDRLPGVGKVTEERLNHLEVQTIADLRLIDLPTLENRLGRYGVLYELASGIDNTDVVPDRPTQSISAEDTFEKDVLMTRWSR